MKLDITDKEFKYGKCPECKTSWVAGDIPEEHREHYSPPYKYSRLIGIELRGKYDGVSYWQCPECKTKWNRWTGIKSTGIL